MSALTVWRPQVDTIYQMDALTLMHQCAAQSVDAIITDLPYGTTACSWDTIIPFDALWAAVRHCLKPRGVFVTTASQPFTSALVMSNPKWFREELTWDKVMVSNVANAKILHLRCHENIIVFTDGQNQYNPQLGRASAPFGRKSATKSIIVGSLGTNYQTEVGYPKTILRFPRPNNLTDGGLHPTQKPVALYEYLIRTYTHPGELVLDPTCGSGTTAIAARNTGRHWICGDTDAGYVEIARQRFLSGIDRLNAKEAAPLDDLPMFRKETA